MYGALPRAARAWRALFERVFADAGVAVALVEHRWPAPIAELWRDPALCCDFMCGWPFTKAPAMQAIAAPVPSPPRYQGQPRYCSEFLVRDGSGFETLEDTFGHTIGWMSEDSQSGYNAPRAYLAHFTSPGMPRLYAASRGPLGSPLEALEALRAGDVDVTALDGFFLDLCRRYEPARLEGLSTVATTPWTPIPLLVAAPGVQGELVARLRDHLLGLHAQPDYRPLLRDVLLDRFVAADVASYGVLEQFAQFAIARDYAAIR